MKKTLFLLAWCARFGSAQDSMSLKDAVHAALTQNKSIEASAFGRKAAESRIAEARSGILPKINFSESWTRSINAVFVFSSLLTQRQFSEQNFQIGSLNRPDPLNNFQSLLTADQSIYDAGQTKQPTASDSPVYTNLRVSPRSPRGCIAQSWRAIMRRGGANQPIFRVAAPSCRRFLSSVRTRMRTHALNWR
jgi:hypothetical protein